MPKVTEETKHLTSSVEVRSLVEAAEKLADNDTETSKDTHVTLKFMGAHYHVLFFYFVSFTSCQTGIPSPTLVQFHKVHLETVLQLLMSWLLGLKTKTVPTACG